MSQAVFDRYGKVIGQLRNSKLEWVCDQYKCTWTNPSLTAAIKKRKRNRLEEGKSVSELYGGLK
jgi:hypothetical protein